MHNKDFHSRHLTTSQLNYVIIIEIYNLFYRCGAQAERNIYFSGTTAIRERALRLHDTFCSCRMSHAEVNEGKK